uniref:7TM_GPCR_Srx domain-containing protein n=1 Tax=Panagrellus redivivus TaxID=6233 RepID=A0A7E4WDC6_PANRE
MKVVIASFAAMAAVMYATNAALYKNAFNGPTRLLTHQKDLIYMCHEDIYAVFKAMRLSTMLNHMFLILNFALMINWIYAYYKQIEYRGKNFNPI